MNYFTVSTLLFDSFWTKSRERERERDKLTDQSPQGNQRLSLQEDGGKAITSRCLTTVALLPENKQIAMSWPVNIKLVKARLSKYEISSNYDHK